MYFQQKFIENTSGDTSRAVFGGNAAEMSVEMHGKIHRGTPERFSIYNHVSIFGKILAGITENNFAEFSE